MVRGYDQAEDAFVKKSGYDLILRAMEDRSAKMCAKATFLLMSLMSPSAKG